MARSPHGGPLALPSLLIVGASARAAAQSARRAGFFVSAADAYCDCDLQRSAQHFKRIENYPQGIAAAIARDASDAWVYTGAMENHLDAFHQLSVGRKLWGNAAAIVQRVRDPQQLFGSLAGAGFDVLPWQTTVYGLPIDGRWLRKPRHSAGGAAIGRWLGEDSAANVTRGVKSAAKNAHDTYYQQFQPGVSLGLSFVANRQSAILLGVAEHLRAAEWSAIGDFQYVGSLGPILLSANVLKICQRLGQFLAAEFALSGLFGVDAVLQDQQIWPLEVNPRYTASMELLERGGQSSLLEIHRDACLRQQLPRIPLADPQSVSAKLIVYAERSLVISERFTQLTAKLNAIRVWPSVADIPEIGSTVPPGRPICTVLSDGETREQALQRLAELKIAIAASLDAAESI